MSQLASRMTESGASRLLEALGTPDGVTHTPEGGTPTSYSAIVDEEETERLEKRGRDEAYEGFQAVYRTRTVKFRVTDLADVGDHDKFTIGGVDYFLHRDGKEKYKRLGPTWLCLILCRPEGDGIGSPDFHIA